MKAKRKLSQAVQADRYVLYQESVQDVETEIDFVQETFQELRGRPGESLREDFCGTANTVCEWIKRGNEHTGYGVDLDPRVLEWGQANNIAGMTPDQQSRVQLLNENVMTVRTEPVDMVLAMNFSYFLFMDRPTMRAYFEHAREALVEDGILFLDAFGGYDAPRELEEPRECEGFTYIWDQASFNPINNQMTCYIHFEFDDGSRQDKAFVYRWRLWSLPELKELLEEAGFRAVDIYWEGTDPETEEGDGIYEPAEVGDADAGWICYIVAQR